jgi:isoleucyl-tRNA synthetase
MLRRPPTIDSRSDTGAPVGSTAMSATATSTFDPVEPNLDLVAIEQAVLTRWRTNDTFAETMRRRADAPEWVFYEGPPTANGQPGIHHVWARIFKDLYPRYKTMRGYFVARKGGWDCHGLPVEVQVERELGFTGKQQIIDYGIEAFNQRCRQSVTRYVEDWQALTSRIGMWIDTVDAYWTLSTDYIESTWWQFRQIWDGGHIYEGYKVIPYCGRCGTALSSHELAQPGAYQDVTEPSIYVRFPLRDLDADLVVWTTTPWTLPGNVAAAVNPAIDYVRARDPEGGRDLILAHARAVEVLGDAVEIVASVAPADLIGQHYQRPFDYVPIDDRASVVVAAEFVTDDDGSGIVHLAPAFGEIDREATDPLGLPVLNPVDENAHFVAPIPVALTGRFVKHTDPDLIELLRGDGRLVKVADYTHSYPHCWRCNTPLIYWAKPTWFARTSAIRDTMIANNETVNWFPDTIKHGRFGNWLEGNIDWALSRDRFWGTPIPVWRCTDGHDTCVGSITELADLAGRDLSDLDPHRPYVDDVAITCPQCSQRARRVEPVLDTWFDSGSMPASQFHRPFENDDVFERRFPADFICEAIDQTRGWFYSLLAVNTMVFGVAPYRNVVCLGHIVDKDGAKMSKSKGNVIDPWTVLDSRGADALRWNMFSAGSPWVTRRMSVESIDDTTNRFLRTLWNTYAFFVTYANIDAWQPGARVAPSHDLDRWARSRLHSTVRAVTDALDGFDALAGAQALDALVDDLSNWYVRRSRARFWKSSDPDAHATLHECLLTVAQLLAPYCPFVADDLWRNLSADHESVHLSDWPEPDADAVDRALEVEMAAARAITSLGRSARSDAKTGVRQPLRTAFVLLDSDIDLRASVVAEIAVELNVKQLEVVRSLDGLLDYVVVPNFRALGPRLGPDMPRVKAILATADGNEVRAALERDGVYRVELDDHAVELGPDDVAVHAQQHESLALAQHGGFAVALDLTLDDELRSEGLARELVRFVNDQRKARGFAIADRVRAHITASEAVIEAGSAHRDWIAGEVLAVELDLDAVPSEREADAHIGGAPVWIELSVA